jgi:hypothetical protein
MTRFSFGWQLSQQKWTRTCSGRSTLPRGSNVTKVSNFCSHCVQKLAL